MPGLVLVFKEDTEHRSRQAMFVSKGPSAAEQGLGCESFPAPHCAVFSRVSLGKWILFLPCVQSEMTSVVRLINDPAIPQGPLKNHKLARGITIQECFNSTCPRNCSRGLWGPETNNSLYVLITVGIKSRKSLLFLIFTSVFKPNLNSASSTFWQKRCSPDEAQSQL